MQTIWSRRTEIRRKPAECCISNQVQLNARKAVLEDRNPEHRAQHSLLGTALLTFQEERTTHLAVSLPVCVRPRGIEARICPPSEFVDISVGFSARGPGSRASPSCTSGEVLQGCVEKVLRPVPGTAATHHRLRLEMPILKTAMSTVAQSRCHILLCSRTLAAVTSWAFLSFMASSSKTTRRIHPMTCSICRHDARRHKCVHMSTLQDPVKGACTGLCLRNILVLARYLAASCPGSYT